MKISKLSGNNSENDWLMSFTLPSPKKDANSPSLPFRVASPDVNQTSDEDVNEETLAVECEKIEHCAKNKRSYFVNASWNSETKSHLREYALACGLESIVEASHMSPTEQKEIMDNIKTKVAEKSSKIVTASAKQPVIDLGDVFKFDERSNTDHMNQRNWQVNTPAQKMASNPVMNSGIVPVRGGENYLIQNSPKLADNQNSLVNPGAIEDMVNSKELDNGQRLANERKEKIAQKAEQKKQWQQDVIDAMPFKDIVAHGKVFPTEMLNAQSGLSSPASQRIANNFDPAAIADKTEGEKIRENNQTRHDSISRPREAFNWEETRPDTSRGVSDLFGEALKKAMKK